jgi:hypothetical protein
LKISRIMARLSICRLLGLIPMAWLALMGTWILLPSPPASHGLNISPSVERLLRIGNTVTTVDEYALSYTGGHSGSRMCGACTGLVLDWHLESDIATDSLILHLGHTRINLTDAAVRGPEKSMGVGGKVGGHYLSEPIPLTPRIGGTSDFTIMPWFNWADKILIGATLHHASDWISLRVFVPEPGVVQIWKDLSLWKDFAGANTLRETEREVGLLASFSHISSKRWEGAAIRANIATVGVSGVKGVLPSKTWPIRHLICGPLYVPTFFILLLIPDPWGNVFPRACILAAVICCFWVRWSTLRSRWRSIPLIGGIFHRDRAQRKPKLGIWERARPVYDEEKGVFLRRPGGSALALPPMSKPSRALAIFSKT